MEMPERRRALLAAGKDLILSQGFTGTAVDEICDRAGVTKGAFFHYWPTKEEYGRDLLAHTWQAFEQAHPENSSPPATLDEHIDFMTRFIASDGRLIPMMAQELGAASPEIGAQVRGYFATWTRWLTTALETAAAGRPGFESRSVMEFIIASIEGVPVVAAQFGPDAVTHTADHLKRYVDTFVTTR